MRGGVEATFGQCPKGSSFFLGLGFRITSLNEIINNKGVCIAYPASLGLLNVKNQIPLLYPLNNLFTEACSSNDG